MKKLSFISLCLCFLACNNPPEADEAEITSAKEVQTAEGAEYILDSTSMLMWEATKPTGRHRGSFDIESGSLIVNNETLTGGEFVIDVASITNFDLAEDTANKARLETHLKSADFFDVAQFPRAQFVITSVQPYIADSTSKTEIVLKDANHIINGNLTIMDSTKNISFPARVNIQADSATANADFIIDRTLWGMNYKGPNDPQDWFINKEVNIKIDLRARKK